MAHPSPPPFKLQVKAVPNASRDQIVGPLGDGLKIKVAAPPEDNKANQAIARLIGQTQGINRQAVQLSSGHSHASKRFVIQGVDAQTIRRKLFRERTDS